MKDKTIVIYQSKYGSTQKYSMWLSEELGCIAYDKTASRKVNFREFNTIIFGSGLYAGGINGVSIITNHWEELKDKNIIVFTVGLADPKNTSYRPILDKNFNDEQKKKIKFFHLRGAIDYKQLSFVHKSMMAMLMAVIKRKSESELSDDDKMMLNTYGDTVDFVNKSSLKPMIDFVVSLEI